MKKRLFLTLLIVSALVCLLAISASAAEYVVSDDSTYTNVAAAFSAASDGDTIIVKKNVTDSFDFSKAITYKLDGVTWKCASGSSVDASGKTISVFAIGNKNSYFQPNGSCWNNGAGTLGTLHWQFGGENENARLVFDFSLCNRRLLYPSNNITMSFLPYSDITNYDGDIGDGTNDRAIRVNELNIYDNVCVYGNKTMNGNGYFVSFIEATTFNMYGGKIFGNASDHSRNGYISTSTFNMYGGEIFNNYMFVTNVGSLINYTNSANIYDGIIYDNHVVGNAGNMDYSVLSSYASWKTANYRADNMSNNILYPSGTTFTLSSDIKTIDGRNLSVYSVDVTGLAPKETYSIAYRTLNYRYSLIFKDKDGYLINAYMVNDDGSILKAVDGSTEITIPASELGWATKANYCIATSVDTTKQGTYYIAIAHSCVDDFNCETALVCTVCDFTLTEALEHIIAETMTYPLGFMQNGVHKNGCTREECNYGQVKELAPLFASKGYSQDTTSNAIVLDFTADNNAIEVYEAFTEKSIVYGVVASPAFSDQKPVNSNGTYKDGALVATFNEKKFSILQLKITNITEKDDVLHCSGFVIFDDAVMYINGSELSDKALKVSYNNYTGILDEE